MKRLFSICVILILVGISGTLSFYHFSESKKMKGSIKSKYMIVYYIHPSIMHYAPVTKDDIEKRCLSKIIIGNKQNLMLKIEKKSQLNILKNLLSFLIHTVR